MWDTSSIWDEGESLVSRSDDYPVYPLAYIIPVLATSVIILDIPPLVWHYKNKNLAAFTMVLWMVLLIFTLFLNAILWPNDDTANWFNGFGVCDVQVYFFVGSWTGIPCCLLCIMRSLAGIMDTKNVVVNQDSSRRKHNLIIDAAICFVPATIQMSVFYVVQKHRFYILGIAGCVATVDNSWVGSLLVFVWPLLTILSVAVYALLILIRLHRYRVEFASLLRASGMTKSRFLRLFVMAFLSVIVILPSQIYVLYYNVRSNLHTYSWDLVHHPNWNVPIKVPTGGHLRFDRWIWLLSGIANFLFFGLGADAFALYRKWLERLGLTKICCCGARRPSILPLTSVSVSQPPTDSHSRARTGSTPSISARPLFGNKAYVLSTVVDRSTASKPHYGKKRSLFTFWRSSTATTNSSGGDEDRSHLTSRGTIAAADTARNSTCFTRRSIATTTANPFPSNYSLCKPSAAPTYGTDASTSSTVLGSPTLSEKERRLSFCAGLREIEIELGPVSPRMAAMAEEEHEPEHERAHEQSESRGESERDRANAEDARRLEEYVVRQLCYGKEDREAARLWKP